MDEKATTGTDVSGGAVAAAAGGGAGAAAANPTNKGTTKSAALASATARLTAALGGKPGKAPTKPTGGGEQRDAQTDAGTDADADAAPPTAGTDAGPEAGAKGPAQVLQLTTEQLESLVQGRIDKAMAGHAADREASDVRERFIREKMNDLPLCIQGLMPKSKDYQVLANAEQAIRKEISEWFRSTAGKKGLLRDVGGVSNDGGTTPGDATWNRVVDGSQGTEGSRKPGSTPLHSVASANPVGNSPVARLAAALSSERQPTRTQAQIDAAYRANHHAMARAYPTPETTY